MILSSLTAPRSSSVGPSVPVSPIFVLRTVVVLRLRTSATLPLGFCCVQMRSCALSFKCGCAVKEKFPIFSGGAGSAGLRAGGGGEESPVVFHRRHRQHTHTERGRRRKTNGGVGRGRPLLLLSVTARAESARPLCVLQSSVTVLLPLAMG